jgi:2C-methyl-D-erythritol 2,4-cyclodiphosphate synthase
MTISQISQKYGISEAYLNSKDDALSIAAASLIDLKNMLDQNHPKQAIADKMEFLANFLRDVKNSTY